MLSASTLAASALMVQGAERTSQDRCPRWHGPTYENAEVTGYVFLSLVGTFLEPRNVNRVFERVRNRAGLSRHRYWAAPRLFTTDGAGVTTKEVG